MCTLRVNNMKTDKTPSAMSYGEEADEECEWESECGRKRR